MEEEMNVRQIEEAFAKGGLAAMHHYIEEEKNKWKKIPVNIAITGSSGAGKSAFINAFRNISKNDPDYAEEGVIETTRKPTPYKHPNHHNLVFWDLPGVGTKLFPKANYLEKVGFGNYDFFLILSAHRFTENDAWLAQEIRARKRPFFFVHTQTDIDVGKEDHTPAVIVVEKIRKYCMQSLEENNFSIPVESLFMISSKDTKAFDFNRLTTALIKSAPTKKREALTLSMTALTEGIILAKREALRSKIYLTAIASAATAAIPIPGLGAAVDAAMLARQVNEYRNQFGLDEISLRKFAKILNTSIEELKTKLAFKSAAFWGVNGILLIVKSMAGKQAGKVPFFLFPLIGSVISAGISYNLCSDTLNEMLDEIANDALKVNKELRRVEQEKMKQKAKL